MTGNPRGYRSRPGTPDRRLALDLYALPGYTERPGLRLRPAHAWWSLCCAGSGHGKRVVVLGGDLGEADRGVQTERAIVIHGRPLNRCAVALGQELLADAAQHVAPDAATLPGWVDDESVHPGLVALAGEPQGADCRAVQFDEQCPLML